MKPRPSKNGQTKPAKPSRSPERNAQGTRPGTRQTRQRRLSAEGVAEALVRYAGNMAAVARSYGVKRSSVREYVLNRPELQLILEDTLQTRLDNAESLLDRALLAGQEWAIKFTLETLGKDRGYSKLREIRHSGGVRMEIVEELVDADLSQNGSPTPGPAGLSPQ